MKKVDANNQTKRRFHKLDKNTNLDVCVFENDQIDDLDLTLSGIDLADALAGVTEAHTLHEKVSLVGAFPDELEARNLSTYKTSTSTYFTRNQLKSILCVPRLRTAYASEAF